MYISDYAMAWIIAVPGLALFAIAVFHVFKPNGPRSDTRKKLPWQP
jgi:hypothetical protein